MDFSTSMSDLFRGRSSTWSAGNPNGEGAVEPEPSDAGFEYAEATLALHNAASNAADQNPGSSGNAATFHYSPASSTHTTTELGSQEFHSNRRIVPDKTPESSTTSEYNQTFFTTSASSPSRNSRDWAGNSAAFQASNFSALSVAGSSPYAHHPDGNGGLLAPCPNYGNSSPYANGACCPDTKMTCQQPGLHSGSPSSVGSQLSIPQPGVRAVPSGGSMNATSVTPTSNNSAKRPARRNPWGSETYSDLIAKAIDSYPEKQATLQQIYDYISTNYTYFRERSDPPASAGWKNSIRHNLSLHDKFIKCPKASESSKSSYWRLNANSLNRPYVRRRTCSLDTPAGSMTGKKAKSRLGGGGAGSGGAATAAKRAAAMVAANGGRKPYGEDTLADLSCRTARSHLSSITSGNSSSAFSIPSSGSISVKQEPGSVTNPWAGNAGFQVDRKPSQEELNFLCKMHAESGSSGNLSLVSGGNGYEFQVPRAPPSSSGRSSFSSGIGSTSGSFFQPSGRYPPPDLAQRYQQGGFGDPGIAYDQLTGILTGSAECLDGDHFLRHPTSDDLVAHSAIHAPPNPPTNSQLHSLLTGGGDAAFMMPGGGPDSLMINNQDAMELRLSLEIANRVAASRTVENGVN